MCKTGCQMNTSKCLTLLLACKYNAIQEKVQLEAKKTTQSTTDAYKFKWGGHL